MLSLLWLGLTLAFEFLAGHFVFGTRWETLIADYNVLEGRLWIVVVIAALIAPPLTFRAAHFPSIPRKFPQRYRLGRNPRLR